MILNISELVGSGSFADVVRHPQKDRVVKLYRRVPNRLEDGVGRNSFRREENAYRSVSRFEDLRRHVPEYFGRAEISDVIDASGGSVGAHYHLDCNLELAFVPGECRKFYELPKQYESTALGLLDRFKGRVAFDYDCSFFNWTDPERIVVIDFAPTS